jgi:hypothetical protein
MDKSGLRSGMLARVQRKADANYNKKCEEWAKVSAVSDGTRTLGKVEVAQKDDFPVRKITKFFSRG